MAETTDHLPLTRSQQRDLVELRTEREELVRQRTVRLNRSKHLTLPVLLRQNREILRKIEGCTARIDAEIRKLVER